MARPEVKDRFLSGRRISQTQLQPRDFPWTMVYDKYARMNRLIGRNCICVGCTLFRRQNRIISRYDWRTRIAFPIINSRAFNWKSGCCYSVCWLFIKMYLIIRGIQNKISWNESEDRVRTGNYFHADDALTRPHTSMSAKRQCKQLPFYLFFSYANTFNSS